MTSGLTVHVFQFAGLRSGNGVIGFEGDDCVAVKVGSGVIGENIRGLGVAVGCKTGVVTSAGNVCVGAASADTEAGVVSAVQAVTSTQTTKVKYSTRFIVAKYSGRKLSGDEFLC
jgi:hypothetical protein